MFRRNGHKYNARKTKTVFDGVDIYCPSALEAAVGSQIEMLRKIGEATELRYQHAVNLGMGVKWKVDFSYWSKALKERVWAEAKGKWDAGALIKKKMWINGAGPGRLEIWQGSWRRPICTGVFYPKSLGAEK